MLLKGLPAGRLIWVAACTLILAIIGTSLASVAWLREQEIELWRQRLADLTLVLAEQTFQTMSSAQLSMDGIAERIEAMGIQSDAELRAKAGSEAMHLVMRDKITGLPQVDVASIVAANGDVINFTRTYPAPAINLSDRDYYQVRRNDPTPGIFVSKAVRNKGNGKWVFYLSRRLNYANGHFMGLVLVGISIDQFTEFYARLAKNLGEGASITLYRRDFSILTRWPRNEAVIGKQNLTGTTHQVVEVKKKNDDVIYSAGPRFFEANAQVARLGAVRVLPRYPMILNLTVTEALFLANWRHVAKLVAVSSTGTTLALLIGTLVLLRTTRQREISATLLKELADQVPGALFQLRMAPDGRARFSFVNKRFHQLYGLAVNEEAIEATSIFAYQHPEDMDRIRNSIRESARTLRPWHEEYRLVLPEKGVMWRQGDAVPQKLEDGTILWHGYISDITDRKREEAELEQYRHHLEVLVEQRTAELLETEARASHILQSSADGLYGIDTDCRITFINPAACELLGYKAEGVIGQRAHGLFHHSKPDGTPYPVEECPTHGSLLHGLDARNDQEVYWHADGHPVPVMYAVHPMLHEEMVIGAVISFVDISEQRAATEAKERALIAAEHLAQVRSEFLANMSHEIRTPINGVLGFAEIGARNYQNSDKARNAFDKILTSGKRLLGVINEILDFSKIEAGKLTIEQVETQLKEVIEHALELVREQANAKHLDLRVELAPDLPQLCLSDPLHLGQVLLNILSNAVKFTGSGSVTLSASRSENQLIFTIADAGIGMNEAQLKQLFNPFEQGDGSLTRKYGGTGLGLAISKRILDLMGGDIRVESQPGAGSTFTFRVPYVEAEAHVQATGSPTVNRGRAARPLAGLSILVAEDEPINRMVLEESLSEDGARVVMVVNGSEAVERVKHEATNAFDIVLMDIQMPEMDGYEATRRILQIVPGLPILGQTAHALMEERDKCLAAGMVGHIAKPIDPDALVDLILLNVKPRVELLGL